MSAGHRLGALAAALALQSILVASAQADVKISGGCVGGWGAGNCVVTVRHGAIGQPGIYKIEEPRGEELQAALERDRKWVARCKPVIRTDAYGVGKYHYAAPGCEFGRTDD